MIKQNDNKVKKYINAFKKKSLMVEQYFEAIIASPPKGEAAKKAVQNAFYECCKKLCFTMDDLLCLCDYTNDNEIVDDREKIIEILRASGYGYFITHKNANANEALADTADALIENGYRKQSDTVREILQMIKDKGLFRYGGYLLHDSDFDTIGKLYGVEVEK